MKPDVDLQKNRWTGYPLVSLRHFARRCSNENKAVSTIAVAETIPTIIGNSTASVRAMTSMTSKTASNVPTTTMKSTPVSSTSAIVLRSYSSDASSLKSENIYSELVAGKQGLPLIRPSNYRQYHLQHMFQEKQNWIRTGYSRRFPNGKMYQCHNSKCLACKTKDAFYTNSVISCSKLTSTMASTTSNIPNCSSAGAVTAVVTTSATYNTNIISPCDDVDSYSNSENCLPRIIKPRKRRKKDRKPNVNFISSPLSVSNASVVYPSGSTTLCWASSTPVTTTISKTVCPNSTGSLNTKLELSKKRVENNKLSTGCSTRSDDVSEPLTSHHHDDKRALPESSPLRQSQQQQEEMNSIVLGLQIALWQPNTKLETLETFYPGTYISVDTSRSNNCNNNNNDNYFNEESNFSGDNVNILTDENASLFSLTEELLQLDEMLTNTGKTWINTSISKLASVPTLKSTAVINAASNKSFCNCRYCDPGSVVWDVRQRCFSPNLMPPAIDQSGSMTSNRDNDNGDDSEKVIKNKDHITTLKRSSSEPTSRSLSNSSVMRLRSLCSGSNKGSNAYGHRSIDSINYVNNSNCSNKDNGYSHPHIYRNSFTYTYGADQFQHDCQHQHNSVPDQNLQVSSQIVTSHNGHRDIEVKFFSSPVALTEV